MHFYCQFYCHPIEAFLMRYVGNLFIACRAVSDLGESITSEIFGHWVLMWLEQVSPAGATA